MNFFFYFAIPLLKLAESLYDQHIYLSGFRGQVVLCGMFQHLVQCADELEPLNVVCCFQFEELNLKVTRNIRSFDLVGHEFLKLWNITPYFTLYIDNLTNKRMSFFILSLTILKSKKK